MPPVFAVPINGTMVTLSGCNNQYSWDEVSFIRQLHLWRTAHSKSCNLDMSIILQIIKHAPVLVHHDEKDKPKKGDKFHN